MGNRFNIVYPKNKRLVFDGGLNNKFERSIIADNESPECQNVRYSNGAVETRGGTVKLNTTSIGSFVGDGLYTRKDDTGAETMVAFAGGTMWALTGASTFTTIGSAQSVFTAGVRVCTTQYQNNMFIGNGFVTPYKWTGADFTRHGVPAATGSVTPSSSSTGLLTGDYRYKVTYVNSFSAEGDVGSSTVTLAVVAGEITLTGIPTAPVSHGVVNRRIYRTDTSGTVFKRVGTIADNSTTTFVDNNPDSALGVAAPTDNGEPPNYAACIYHQNRLFVTDPSQPNFIFYSDLGEPFTFQSTNFFKVGDGSTDLTVGFGVFDDSVVVFCQNSQWINYLPSSY